MQWLGGVYDRRVVNVNENNILAGPLAMGVTAGGMHLLDVTGVLPVLKGKAPNIHFDLWFIHVHILGGALAVSGMTLGVDALADIIVYMGLHWFANQIGRAHV